MTGDMLDALHEKVCLYSQLSLSRIPLGLAPSVCLREMSINLLSPKIHMQILQTDLHIFLLRILREFGLKSKYSPFGNQLSNSDNLDS